MPKAHKVSWYMLHYGSPTPKKSYAYSNSRHVADLNAGKLRGWAKSKKALASVGKTHDLVVKYHDKKGHQRWKGGKHLRGSEYQPYLKQTCLRFKALEGIHNPYLVILILVASILS